MIRNMYEVDCVLLWCAVYAWAAHSPSRHHSILHEQTQNRDMISIVCLGIYDGWQWLVVVDVLNYFTVWLPVARQPVDNRVHEYIEHIYYSVRCKRTTPPHANTYFV